MTVNVLFMCPHSAGKSLLAATYFKAAAARRAVEVHIDIAGTDPDDVPMPVVQEALAEQGFGVGWLPAAVTEADTAGADMIVSIGCAHGEVPTTKHIVEWDVPMISTDLAGSMQAIHELAEELAASLQGSA